VDLSLHKLVIGWRKGLKSVALSGSAKSSGELLMDVNNPTNLLGQSCAVAIHRYLDSNLRI
jgi:hypothetical protein